MTGGLTVVVTVGKLGGGDGTDGAAGVSFRGVYPLVCATASVGAGDADGLITKDLSSPERNSDPADQVLDGYIQCHGQHDQEPSNENDHGAP